jgi:hypothetical protein
MGSATKRNLVPSQWDQLSALDKAEMIAFDLTVASMESHELWRMERDRKNS